MELEILIDKYLSIISILFMIRQTYFLHRPHEYPFEKLEFGRWQIKINSESGACKVKHLSRLKLVIRAEDGNTIYR